MAAAGSSFSPSASPEVRHFSAIGPGELAQEITESLATTQEAGYQVRVTQAHFWETEGYYSYNAYVILAIEKRET
jgi:hypothetical protein